MTNAAAHTPTTTAVAYTRSLPVEDPQCLLDVTMPVPTLGPRDLLVDVRAVSVNPVDTKLRTGADPGGEPRVLGFDAAGVAVATGGEVSLFAVGDEVYYAGSVNRPGTNMALHAVDERIVGRKPSSLDFAAAAALPLATITAWECLFDRLGLTPQSTGTLLVVGASGGVGSMVLQLIKVLVPGVRTIATASRPEAVEWVVSLGADDVVDHHEDLVAQVKALAPGGVDWVFTAHSDGQIETYATLLRPFGHVVAIDDPSRVDVRVFKPKSLTWHWELMFTRSVHQTPDMAEQGVLLTRVAGLVDDGVIRTTETRRLGPLTAATLREAHRLLESGHTIGKVVLTV
jgi:zinc-binding alcohol dehydrogenase family protein